MIVMLSSCGGGGNQQPLTPDNSNKTPLRKVTNTELAALIRTALLKRYGETGIQPPAVLAVDPAVEDADNFSSTNLQVAAVDEADRLKNDTDYLYVASASTSSVKAYKADSGQSTLISELTLDTNGAPIGGLYLDGGQLIALTGTDANYWDRWFDEQYWQQRSTQVFFLNSVMGQLAQQHKLLLDGQLISSRKVGSTLYLFTRYTPALPGLVDYPQTDAEVATNKAIIEASVLSDYLPSYSLDGSARGNAINPADCFTTQYSKQQSSNTSLISVIAIDLATDTPVPMGKCFLGDAESVYMSPESLYLATTKTYYENVSDVALYPATVTTDIHKFSLKGTAISYRGSAEVDGHLGWRQSQKAFRMDESKGVFRIITYLGDQPGTVASPARLTLLQEDRTTPDTLSILSQLPNAARPAPLGKPGEQIYGSRFIGDKGYLVTFRVTDPLYIIDLSDPSDPFIAGELEIDGYSDYLHPVGDNLLLGIGKDAVADNSNSGSGDGRGAWYQGVKVSLIDISDPQNPVEKEKMIIGKRGTETAVSRNHRAFTQLRQGTQLKVAIPVSLHDNDQPSANPSEFHAWKYNELYRFSVDIDTASITILPAIIPAPNPENSANNWPDERSAIIGDTVHYLQGDRFTSVTW